MANKKNRCSYVKESSRHENQVPVFFLNQSGSTIGFGLVVLGPGGLDIWDLRK